MSHYSTGQQLVGFVRAASYLAKEVFERDLDYDIALFPVPLQDHKLETSVFILKTLPSMDQDEKLRTIALMDDVNRLEKLMR